MNHLLRSILFSALLIVIISCEKDDLNGNVVDDTQLREKLYLNAVDTVIVDNQNIVLVADISRNFMPGGTIKKSTRLVAAINLVNTDSLQISQNIKIKTLYVINNNNIWISTPKLSENTAFIPIYELRSASVDGPEWETGTYVDVVMLIEDLTNGEEKYLSAQHVIIERVE